MIFQTQATDRDEVLVKRYQKVARWYDGFTDYEEAHHAEAAALAAVGPRDRVLDVACGTGRGLAALSSRLDPDVVRTGLDRTPAMLDRARRRLARAGFGAVTRLEAGSAAALPFADASFDLVYSGYFFDLVPLEDFGSVLTEMRRVLVAGGRLVLVNMSKNSAAETRYERLYAGRKLGVFSGACRPVLMAGPVAAAGFTGVERRYRDNRSVLFFNRWFGTEILTAVRP